MNRSAAIGTDSLRVAIAQISPIWLSRTETISKVRDWCAKAASNDCQLVVFGEALIPGYPFWLDRMDGARFDSPLQKSLHAHYMQEAVQIERMDLAPICEVAKSNAMGIMVGCVERPSDRGGHTLYCALVYIDPLGEIQSVHRKLMPTYEERLAWGPGDGHGLRVHELGPFTLGGLNCWENWMPLARAALYGFGEDLHVAVWPGSRRNTEEITRVIAREGRSYVISASALMRREDIGNHIPDAEQIRAAFEERVTDGGSCIAAPSGEWIIEPCIHEERLLVADLEHTQVRMERQNFDPAGHYARPDVLRLVINQWRQAAGKAVESSEHVTPSKEHASLPAGATGMPRLHAFTDRAKLTVTLALEASRELDQLEVLPEHLLLAILSEGAGTAAGALGCLGLGYERFYRAVKQGSLGTTAASPDAEPRFSSAAHLVLNQAVLEAEAMGHRFAGTEHLLVGLCKASDDRFDSVLEAVDLSTATIRDELAAIMRHGT